MVKNRIKKQTWWSFFIFIIFCSIFCCPKKKQFFFVLFKKRKYPRERANEKPKKNGKEERKDVQVQTMLCYYWTIVKLQTSSIFHIFSIFFFFRSFFLYRFTFFCVSLSISVWCWLLYQLLFNTAAACWLLLLGWLHTFCFEVLLSCIFV